MRGFVSCVLCWFRAGAWRHARARGRGRASSGPVRPCPASSALVFVLLLRVFAPWRSSVSHLGPRLLVALLRRVRFWAVCPAARLCRGLLLWCVARCSLPGLSPLSACPRACSLLLCALVPCFFRGLAVGAQPHPGSPSLSRLLCLRWVAFARAARCAPRALPARSPPFCRAARVGVSLAGGFSLALLAPAALLSLPPLVPLFFLAFPRAPLRCPFPRSPYSPSSFFVAPPAALVFSSPLRSPRSARLSPALLAHSPDSLRSFPLRLHPRTPFASHSYLSSRASSFLSLPTPLIHTLYSLSSTLPPTFWNQQIPRSAIFSSYHSLTHHLTSTHPLFTSTFHPSFPLAPCKSRLHWWGCATRKRSHLRHRRRTDTCSSPATSARAHCVWFRRPHPFGVARGVTSAIGTRGLAARAVSPPRFPFALCPFPRSLLSRSSRPPPPRAPLPPFTLFLFPPLLPSSSSPSAYRSNLLRICDICHSAEPISHDEARRF